MRPILKIWPTKWSFCPKVSQEKILDKNHLAFLLCPMFTMYFFYIQSSISLSGRMFIPDVLEMIQFKGFIAGSGIFSKLFLRISFGQTYYTLKFNLWESFFSPLLFSSAKTSTFERWFLVAKRFLNPAINPSLPLKNKKVATTKSLKSSVDGYIFFQLLIHSFKSHFTTCRL